MDRGQQYSLDVFYQPGALSDLISGPCCEEGDIILFLNICFIF